MVVDVDWIGDRVVLIRLAVVLVKVMLFMCFVVSFVRGHYVIITAYLLEQFITQQHPTRV